MNDDTSINDAALVRLRHGGPEDRDGLAALAKADPEVRQRLADWDRQDAALASLYNPLAEEPVPARHQALIAAAASEPRWLFQSAGRIAAAMALVCFGAAGGWLAAQQQASERVANDFAAEALRAYATYTVEVTHPVEVQASDGVHLVNWLSKRLGWHLTPPDLASYGFHLLGGRVLPDTNGTAVLIMYENDLGRRITIYVAPAPNGPETAFRFAQNDSAQGFWWVDNQVSCALLGDLPRDMLRTISLSAYHQINDA